MIGNRQAILVPHVVTLKCITYRDQLLDFTLDLIAKYSLLPSDRFPYISFQSPAVFGYNLCQRLCDGKRFSSYKRRSVNKPIRHCNFL